MIQVTCPHCGLKVLVPPTVEGRVGACFGCGAKVQVPAAKTADQLEDVKFAVKERVAGRYIIQEQIGSGGMGVVYKAYDELIDEEIALKFMNPRTLKTQKGQRLFIKEAQVARRLRHENIVAVHDVSTTETGVLYLSMELLKGPSLRSYLRKHREGKKLFPVRLAVHVTLQVLSALEYAHRMVVHRDLKPENVMLLTGERAKVLDFGLAIAVEDEWLDQPHDGKGKRIVGTAAYASPEQLRHQPIDFRSDLYSVGLMLRELLTLRTPVEEQVSVLSFRQDVSPSVIEVLDKAMIHDKELRWQSAREFHDALKKSYQDSYESVAMAVPEPSGSDVDVSTDNMVFLEGGSFLMGSNAIREEAPEFATTIAPFYIDIYPVTVEEYEKFLDDTEHEAPKFWNTSELNGPRQPVCGVTFEDALAYAAWAGKLLPTEKQWEYAARGKENRTYPWGSLDPESTRCNFGDYLGMPSIVTMHDEGSTPEGIHDMGGNVYEWTLDAFVPYNPKNGGDNTQAQAPRRVARGGSWHSQKEELRVTYRKGLFPDTHLTTVGFRCVMPASNIRKT